MRVVTLEGRSTASFIEEREKLLSQGATSPPIFTTQEENQYEDKKVFINMSTFLKKKRNGDFGQVIDADGVLLGVSNYLFID